MPSAIRDVYVIVRRDGGMITKDGIALREDIERATDRLTASIYNGLDEPSQHEVLGSLCTLTS